MVTPNNTSIAVTRNTNADVSPRIVGPLRLAIRAAQQSAVRFRMGAVLFHGASRIISYGYNKQKTHPRGVPPRSKGGYPPTIHAELDAVLGVDRDDMRNARLLVIRLTKSGLLATSRPCPGCIRLLEHCRISLIYYVDESRKIVEEYLS